MNKITGFYIVFGVFLSVLFVMNGCGSDNKQTQSSLTNIEEDKKFALTLYGDEVKVIAKGDLLGNSKQSAIAAIVMKQTDNSYWIRKRQLYSERKRRVESAFENGRKAFNSGRQPG